MKALWLDPFGGLAGDMFLGGLLDLDLDPQVLLDPLRGLDLPDAPLVTERVDRRGLAATRAWFDLPEEHHHRHLPDILALLERADLTARAREGATRAFRLLAEAEARRHGVGVDEVHFHEVGALDAILEITSVAVALDHLGIAALRTSPLPSGGGLVRCAHGALPAPAPAVMDLLEGFEVRVDSGQGEMVTPTGAALLRAYGEPLREGTRLVPGRSGFGAGTRSESVLRVVEVDLEEPAVAGRDRVVVLETHLDDTSPEVLGYALERLMEAGALDATYHPLVMKKGRPGVALTCLGRPADARRLREVIFAETSTLGVREREVDRAVLPREVVEIETSLGRVPVKRTPGRAPAPEYEACARIARERGVPLREVYEEVRRALAP